MTDEIAVTKDEIDSILADEIVHVDGYELRKGNPLKSGEGVIQTRERGWRTLMNGIDETIRWSSDVPNVVLREEEEIAVTKDEIDSILDGETIHIDGYEIKTGDPCNAGDDVIQTHRDRWIALGNSYRKYLRWSSDVPNVVLREEPTEEEVTFSEDELRTMLINVAAASWNAARYRGQFRADALTDTQETIIEREVDSWMENNL